MYKIGVIGDRDSVMGFMAVGFSVFTAENGNDAARIFKKIAREDFAVIYITEELAAKIPAEIDKYKDKTLPAVILIPSKNGTTGLGMGNIKKSVERAVGADILFKNS
ncbi:MAG: V-type ATP synthase subunit F [Eubacteriales bacterium]